jgi:hypothetical protein
MPDVFHLLSEYFWMVCLAFGAFNYWKARSTADATATGETNTQKTTYLKRFAIAANLPWVVMGVGQMSGFTPTVWHYFRPQDGNPFVLAWLAAIFCLSAAYAWWVLFAGGAEKVRDLELLGAIGQHSTKPQSIRAIKLFAVLGVVIVPVWILLAISQNAPLPR